MMVLFLQTTKFNNVQIAGKRSTIVYGDC